MQKIGCKSSQVLQQGGFGLRGYFRYLWDRPTQPIGWIFDEVDESNLWPSPAFCWKCWKSSTEGSRWSIVARGRFYTWSAANRTIAEQSANEEFKSYLAEILGEIFLGNSSDVENLLVSFTRSNIPYSIILNTLLFSGWLSKMNQIARFELDTANLLTEDLHKNRLLL